MKLTKLIPKVFYEDINVGLNLFVKGMGFTIVYQETEPGQKFYILAHDSLRIYLVEDEEFAKKDRPEIRIETDDIEAFYKEVKNNNIKLLHPNLAQIKSQPWGLKEFALRDESDVCIIVQQ